MLNPFPDLLTFGFFAPTLLRVAAALVFAAVAYTQWQRRHELAKLHFMFGLKGAWTVWLAVGLGGLVAVGLFFGYYTQWAALVGALLSLKGAVWGKRYPKFFPVCRAEYILVFVICLSLLLSGAGALAFDLRL